MFFGNQLRVAAVAVLELLARTARAGFVAADLGRRAAHRVDLVAQRQGQLVQLGNAGDDVVDGVAERSQRQLTCDQRGRALLVVGQEAEQARQRRPDRGLVELRKARQEADRLLEAGDPWQESCADRVERSYGIGAAFARFPFRGATALYPAFAFFET